MTVWDSASLPLRVLPTDIDIALHVNNGMYLSLMDLGRFDLMVRSGVWTRMRRRGWGPVVAAETIAFRPSAIKEAFTVVLLHKHFYEYMQDVCRQLEEYVQSELRGVPPGLPA